MRRKQLPIVKRKANAASCLTERHHKQNEQRRVVLSASNLSDEIGKAPMLVEGTRTTFGRFMQLLHQTIRESTTSQAQFQTAWQSRVHRMELAVADLDQRLTDMEEFFIGALGMKAKRKTKRKTRRRV